MFFISSAVIVVGAFAYGAGVLPFSAFLFVSLLAVLGAVDDIFTPN